VVFSAKCGGVGDDEGATDRLNRARVDRLGRSLQDLVGFLSEIHALGIDLFLHQLRLMDRVPSTAAAKADECVRRPVS
jgi:DNA invertase Pin-like site-specific DNA recombinase